MNKCSIYSNIQYFEDGPIILIGYQFEDEPPYSYEILVFLYTIAVDGDIIIYFHLIECEICQIFKNWCWSSIITKTSWIKVMLTWLLMGTYSCFFVNSSKTDFDLGIQDLCESILWQMYEPYHQQWKLFTVINLRNLTVRPISHNWVHY